MDSFSSVVTDPFVGVTVDLGEEAGMAPEDFADALGGFLDACEGEGKRGIWLNAPLDATHLVPVAVEMGFVYHHADEEGAVLTLWLPEDQKNGLPSYPHIGHGVGGIVINSRGELLGIQEKAGVTAGMTNFWKIPGGLVDKGEDMHVAAVREILEETGVKTKFLSIAAIRESQVRAIFSHFFTHFLPHFLVAFWTHFRCLKTTASSPGRLIPPTATASA